MMDAIIARTKEFISIPSDPDNRQALKKILDLSLLDLADFTIERFEHNGVASALVYNTPQRPEQFTLLLSAHLDVIPGKSDQYTPKVHGDKLYGVGAMDMKANAACMIQVFKDIAQELSYPIALQLVTDEEIGGFDGTKHQVDQGVRAKFILAGEPTNFDIVNKAKGVLWLQIIFQGVSAHGAYPWRGKNAIWSAHTFLAELKKEYPSPIVDSWITTVNLATIETKNEVLNKVPDTCIIGLDIRYISEDSNDIVSNIEQLLPEESSIKILAKEFALYTDERNEYIQILQTIGEKVFGMGLKMRGANGTSDARHFMDVGGHGIEFGPIGGGIGSDEEWVSISSLGQYYMVLREFLLALS